MLPARPAIVSVHSNPSHPLAAHARTLFHQYGDFLRRTLACNTVNFTAFDQEVAALPAAYSHHNGEVLLILHSPDPAQLTLQVPAACIAYRAALTGPRGFAPDPSGRTGEIKRLFVADPFRTRGLARLLVAEALQRLAARGFTRIVLDTDHTHMPAALALYRTFGFVEYAPPETNISFLHLTLP